MSNVDPFPNDPFLTPEQRPSRKPVEVAHVRIVTDIITDSTDLVSILRSRETPTFSDHTFVFEDMQLLGARLPESVRDTLQSRMLTGINLIINAQVGEPSNLSIQFINDDDSIVHISRSGLVNDSPAPDHIIFTGDKAYNERNEPVAPVTFPRLSNSEIVGLIVSLVNSGAPSQDYEVNASLLEKQDLLAPQFYELLVAALENSTDTYLSQEFYELKNADDKPIGSLDFMSENGQLSSMTLTLDSISTAFSVIAKIDCQPGTRAQIAFYAVMSEDGKKTDFEPTSEELRELHDFIVENIRSYRPEIVQYINPDELADPDSLEIDGPYLD